MIVALAEAPLGGFDAVAPGGTPADPAARLDERPSYWSCQPVQPYWHAGAAGSRWKPTLSRWFRWRSLQSLSVASSRPRADKQPRWANC